MTVIPELHPILETWLLEGPLSAQIPAYVNRLERGRYAAQTRRRCLSAVAHFAHWMSMCSLPARMIDEGCVEQFLRCHLPRCDCPRCAPRTPSDAHGAMIPMLEILRVEGVIAWPPVPSGSIADELRRYDAHMRDACGLAAGTRRGRLRIVERHYGEISITVSSSGSDRQDEHSLMAWSAVDERQPTSIVNSEGWFRSARSADRLSVHAPLVGAATMAASYRPTGPPVSSSTLCPCRIY